MVIGVTCFSLMDRGGHPNLGFRTSKSCIGQTWLGLSNAKYLEAKYGNLNLYDHLLG